MSLSMSQLTIPVFVRALTQLSSILTKAEAYATTKSIEPSVLIQSRLAPDMFPLVRQVQIASDGVKGCVARLAGIEIPSYADTEASFAELQERIAKTVAFIKSVPAAQIDGSEGRSIIVKTHHQELHFEGLDYLTNFVLPNLYFHTTTAYAILRHNGLDIGKKDYLGNVEKQAA